MNARTHARTHAPHARTHIHTSARARTRAHTHTHTRVAGQAFVPKLAAGDELLLVAAKGRQIWAAEQV